MNHEVFKSAHTRLWYMGEPPLYVFAASIEDARRTFGDSEPKLPWRVVVSAVLKPSMLLLHNFPAGSKLIITHRTRGRADVFDANDVIGELKDCRPLMAWVDTLVDRQVDGLVTYKLKIACELELFPVATD